MSATKNSQTVSKNKSTSDLEILNIVDIVDNCLWLPTHLHYYM